MITLFSTKYHERTTNDIIEWLNHFGAQWQRINGEEIEEVASSFIIDESIRYSGLMGKKLESLNRGKNVIFFRRLASFKKNIDCNTEIEFFNSTEVYQKSEFFTSSTFLFSQIFKNKENIWIGNPFTSNLNKLKVLKEATDVGLKTPPTLVCSSRKILMEFLELHGGLIVKSLSDIFAPQLCGKTLNMYTKEVNFENISSLPSSFYLSCFQKMISKLYELRVFYFLGQFFSMAIFSQNRDESIVDFRNYNHSNPDRFVPITGFKIQNYKVVQQIEFKQRVYRFNYDPRK